MFTWNSFRLEYYPCPYGLENKLRGFWINRFSRGGIGMRQFAVKASLYEGGHELMSQLWWYEMR